MTCNFTWTFGLEWLKIKFLKFWFFRNPTPEPSDILDDVSWMPFLMKSSKYLNIKEKLTVEGEYYYYDRISFWEKLFPL